jgi:DNA helicase-2/ATP-dependent DNA helicase PcrA
MVDEYQDSNVAQFELLKELAGYGAANPENTEKAYLCVVGDDDQSIYRFRGAEVRNILEFPQRFDGADIIRLEQNYRSFAPILKLASSVVDHNTGRLGKTLRAERGSGKTPALVFLPDQDAEAAFCAELIQKAMKKTGREQHGQCRYADWAILYRTNAQSQGFESEFLRRHIPYRVVGSLKFYEREEIKDALALLSFLVNPRDEVAFRRVVNKPARGIGPATVDRIADAAAMSVEAPGDLEVAARALEQRLSAKAGKGLAAFFKAIEAGRACLQEEKASAKEKLTTAAQAAKKEKSKKDNSSLKSGEGLSVCIVTLVEEAGITGYHLSHDEIAGNQRLENLQELANAASIYGASREGLLEFLENIELDRSIEEAQDQDEADFVTLITLHNTKGLEFRRVIMTGVEQGVFPRDDKKDDDLEEERRLFYVGATRAMDELYLTSCAMRRMYGRTMPMQPSLFLLEADKSCLRVLGDAPRGYAAHSYAAHNHAIKPPAAIHGSGPAVASSDGRWSVGDRVFHDDQGYGAVVGIRESGEGPVIQARFDTGREISFLSLHQSSRFTKVHDE